MLVVGCSAVSQVEGLSDATVVGVACGAFHSLAVTSTGKLYEWGMIHTDVDVAAGEVRWRQRKTNRGGIACFPNFCFLLFRLFWALVPAAVEEETRIYA